MKRLRELLNMLFLDGFRAAPVLMWTTLVVTVVHGLAMATFPLGFKVFVDAAVAADTAGMVVGVTVSGGLIAIFWIAAMLDANLGFGLIDRMDLFVSTRIAQRVNLVASVEHFERPDYLQELDVLDQNRYLLHAAPRQTLTALSSIVRGTAMIVLLATVHPAMVLLPIFGIAPGFGQSWSVRIRQRAEEAMAEQKRLADELFALSTSAAAAKELRVYGLTGEVAARQAALADEVSRALSRASIRGAAVSAVGWLVFVAGFIGGVALVVQRAVAGAATPGEVVLAVVLAQEVRRLLTEVAGDLAVMLTTAKTATRALWLEDFAAAVPSPTKGAPPPARLLDGIQLRDVSFRYPGTDAEVLRHIDLTLPAGASIAVVGENGAGKTTLVKLLSGMYRPTAGSIAIDGTNLDDLALDEWRSRIAAVFQDCVRYELVASEVVGVGDLPRVAQRDAVDQALSRASATDVVATLEGGLDTQLGRSFPDGRELSGGQWQKLALGRGMMRDDPLLLVLDEPTASLDAETEHALFERYIDAARRNRATAGAVTILVSHRFSTVRAADLIVVLDDGAVAEVGTHTELMAKGRLYAELFRLQSRAYR